MKKINIKQIEKITKVFTALCCASVISVMFINTNNNQYYADTIRGMTIIGFVFSLPLYVLVRFYNHVVDLITIKE